MTHEHQDPGPVPSPAFAVIDALLDREPVDAEALKRALAAPDGRDYFVDLLALREAVAGLGDVAITERAPRRASGLTRWTAAAVAALVASAGGYLAGGHARAAADVPGSSVEIAAGPAFTPVAPAPTRVIRLQPGVHWRSAGGD